MSPTAPLRLGTRGSELALWQAHHVTAMVRERLGRRCEIVIVKTRGDRIQDVAFHKMEGKGFFTKELQDALLERQVDLVVHSLKDLPTEEPEGLDLVAIPERGATAELLLARPGTLQPDRGLPPRPAVRGGARHLVPSPSRPGPRAAARAQARGAARQRADPSAQAPRRSVRRHPAGSGRGGTARARPRRPRPPPAPARGDAAGAGSGSARRRSARRRPGHRRPRGPARPRGGLLRHRRARPSRPARRRLPPPPRLSGRAGGGGPPAAGRPGRPSTRRSPGARWPGSGPWPRTPSAPPGSASRPCARSRATGDRS